MSIINQIPPLNLNMPISALMALMYEFAKNKQDAVDTFDNELDELNKELNSVNYSVREAKRGKEIQAKELKKLGATTEGCTVADKNKRIDNIINSLEKRRNNLENQINSVEADKNSTEQFYDSAANTIRGILNTLIDLLRNLIRSIGAAITTIESTIATLSAIPLGVGLAGVAILTSVVQLLQTKIFEPSSDTISQHENAVEGEERVESDGSTKVTTTYGKTQSQSFPENGGEDSDTGEN